MNCAYCELPPESVCLCSNALLCNRHVSDYLKTTSTYKLERLVSVDSNQIVFIKKRLLDQIKYIYDLETQISSESKRAIKLIEENCKKVRNKLDEYVKNLTYYLRSKFIYMFHIKDIENLLEKGLMLRNIQLKIDKYVNDNFEKVFQGLKHESGEIPKPQHPSDMVSYDNKYQTLSTINLNMNSYQESKEVTCKSRVAEILNSNKLTKDISLKYDGEIIFQGNKFLVLGKNKSSLDQMINDLENLKKEYTCNEYVSWAYLENDGNYKLYDKNTIALIEDSYWMHYHLLKSENYENYSLACEFSIGGESYFLEFARLGGIHRQKKKYSGGYIIRCVKRRGNGMDFNMNFVRNYRWGYINDCGDFKEYEPENVFVIEHAYIGFRAQKTKNSRVLIQAVNGKAYEINFKKMCVYNKITLSEASIKRKTIHYV